MTFTLAILCIMIEGGYRELGIQCQCHKSIVYKLRNAICMHRLFPVVIAELMIWSMFCDHQDGRIWKERVSSGASRRVVEAPVLQEQIHAEPELPRTRQPPNRRILPSISAPEHNILKLLEECNASGISFNTWCRLRPPSSCDVVVVV